jgi:hypothetical protein
MVKTLLCNRSIVSSFFKFNSREPHRSKKTSIWPLIPGNRVGHRCISRANIAFTSDIILFHALSMRISAAMLSAIPPTKSSRNWISVSA